MTDDGRRARVLAIDTATSRVVIALGGRSGLADGVDTWVAGRRHGETLLPAIGRVLVEHGTARSSLVGIIVGTGPGAFTGLRVGIATAKGLAHGLGIPLVGVSSGEALLAAARASDPSIALERLVLLLPAGPRDRLVIRAGSPPVALASGLDPDVATTEVLVAVDLEGRAPMDATARGDAARAGLGAALLAAGASRLDDAPDELATLVPDYVTLPRGVGRPEGSIAWSRDHR